jgi:hypothetical protein
MAVITIEKSAVNAIATQSCKNPLTTNVKRPANRLGNILDSGR